MKKRKRNSIEQIYVMIPERYKSKQIKDWYEIWKQKERRKQEFEELCQNIDSFYDYFVYSKYRPEILQEENRREQIRDKMQQRLSNVWTFASFLEGCIMAENGLGALCQDEKRLHFYLYEFQHFSEKKSLPIEISKTTTIFNLCVQIDGYLILAPEMEMTVKWHKLFGQTDQVILSKNEIEKLLQVLDVVKMVKHQTICCLNKLQIFSTQDIKNIQKIVTSLVKMKIITKKELFYWNELNGKEYQEIQSIRNIILKSNNFKRDLVQIFEIVTVILIIIFILLGIVWLFL